jgi:G:T-mismatch repair DNA endonuclease (very short patch repair protein)
MDNLHLEAFVKALLLLLTEIGATKRCRTQHFQGCPEYFVSNIECLIVIGQRFQHFHQLFATLFKYGQKAFQYLHVEARIQ